MQNTSTQPISELVASASETVMTARVGYSVDGIITIDVNGIIQACNAAGAVLFGYTPGEVIGHNINFLMPEPYHSEHDGYLQRFVDSGRTMITATHYTLTGLRKDGSTFQLDSVRSYAVVENRPLFTAVLRDLTEMNKQEIT